MGTIWDIRGIFKYDRHERISILKDFLVTRITAWCDSRSQYQVNSGPTALSVAEKVFDAKHVLPRILPNFPEVAMGIF